MYNIAVLGEADSIYGFAAIGLEIFPEEDPTEAAKQLKRLADNKYAVVYITEKLASALGDELEKYAERKLPAIIPIPGATGNNGFGIARVKRFVEQAVGSDIIFNGD